MSRNPILRDKTSRSAVVPDGTGPAVLPDSGFSLIELLVSVLILVVGVVAVAQLVPTSMSTDLRNRNDSTSLIAAQELLEQMSRQTLTSTVASCTTTNPPASSYAYCDDDGNGIALGTSTAPATLPGTTSTGCSLNSAGQIDFTLASTDCSGYTVIKTLTWNPVNGATEKIELRWRVVTLWDTIGNPYRKVYIVGGRAGGTGLGFVIANLQSVVGR